MKTKALIFLTLTITITLIALNSCKHEYVLIADNTPVVGGAQQCSPDTVYFRNVVQPLLNSSCAMSGCHDAASHRDGVILTSYAEIVNTGKVVPGNAAISKLYKSLNGSDGDLMPRSPVAPFTQVQKDIVYKWIMQGALNNACNNCDTATFSYSAAINTMMVTYCTGCHNASLTGGGYDLSNYNGVKLAVVNNRLLGTIAHAPGFSAMPKSGNKLSDCQVTQVQKWIAAGAPNN
jgi:mono/diheme cytochrome c family protein